MPEIKIKHVVSFSSEDKVHKAENLVKPETYRKWKCASPGEKSATVVLQFEKAIQVNSIDIGNESSAFVEVLVGRSSDSVSDFQVLLVASSFMSPLESRNGTHTNRVRMFGPDKLSQSTKDEKWDCVQVICTQPFNKSITYGLSFIKFHSLPDKNEEQSKNLEAEKVHTKLGAFKLKFQDEEDDSPSVGSWFGKQKMPGSNSPSSTTSTNKLEPSYATTVLASSSNISGMSPQNNNQKRKIDEKNDSFHEPPPKKALNKDNITYKNVLRDFPESAKKDTPAKQDISKTPESRKMQAVITELKKKASIPKKIENKTNTTPASSKKPGQNLVKLKQKVPFNKIMDKVVFVLSGFVNPLRGEIRDKALEMGAKYKGDWDRSCTHLVCAFTNTPKYTQVQRLKGKIVTKEWILDCHNKKEKISWTKYILGKTLRRIDDSDDSDGDPDFDELANDSDDDDNDFSEDVDDSDDDPDFSEELDDDDEEEDSKMRKRKKLRNNVETKKRRPGNPTAKKGKPSSPKNKPAPSVNNNSDTPTRRNDSSKINKKDILSKGSMSESETEDEDALQDYMAATDVDSDSGGDTEDEIRKVMEAQKNGKSPSKKDSDLSEAPDVTDLPLPELPNLFKQKRFFLFGDFSSSKRHDVERFIIAYNGILEDYMNDKIKYVITEAKWDKHFEDALSENEDLIFVKPTWINKCHATGKLVPFQPYIVIPDS